LPLIPFMACPSYEYSLGHTGDVSYSAYRVLVHAEVIAKCRDAHIRVYGCIRSVAKWHDSFITGGWRLRSSL